MGKCLLLIQEVACPNNVVDLIIPKVTLLEKLIFSFVQRSMYVFEIGYESAHF